ncbi:MAG: 23S rRNA pseudouridine(2604) synthase RluF, partial [Halomonas sp.]
GKVTKRCKIQKESTFVFTITLVQGLNRQIRRMCEYFGYEVTQLIRTRIMNVPLKGLALGDWRDLTAKEIDTIIALTEKSEAVPDKKSKPERPNYSARSGAGKTKQPAAKAAGAKPPLKGKRAASGKVRTGPKASAPGKPHPKAKAPGKPSTKSKPKGKPVGKGRGKPAVAGKPSQRRK